MHGHRQAIANLAKNAADSYARGMKKALEGAPAKSLRKPRKPTGAMTPVGFLFCQLFAALPS